MAPRPKPTLPASLFSSTNNQSSGLATPAGGHPSTRPSQVTLVLSGTAGAKATDQAIQRWLKHPDGLSKGPDGQKTTIRSVIYQLAQGEKIETLDQFQIALTTSGLPITAIQPLLSLPPNLELPPPSAPPHLSLSYSLPTISKADQIDNHLDDWDKILKQAHERQYALEFNLANDDEVREKFEELLGKNFEMMLKDQDGGEDILDTSKGAQFVIDNFGSPPMNLSSSELLRSDSLRNWAEFISRLALHPRLYVKLSPLATPSVLSGSNPSRPSDSTSLVSDATSSITEGLKDLSTSASNTLGTPISTSIAKSAKEERAEMARKIRIFLDVLLEAFGEDRLIWSSELNFGEKLVGDAEKTLAEKTGLQGGNDENFNDHGTKEWFELCREKFADMGVSKELMEKIFRE